MISDKNFVDAAEGKTYFILNYGCQMNESDAEHYAGQLEEMAMPKRTIFIMRILSLLIPAAYVRARKNAFWAKSAN